MIDLAVRICGSSAKDRTRSQAVRFLRILLTCMIVWLASGPAVAAPVLTDPVVCVSSARETATAAGVEAPRRVRERRPDALRAQVRPFAGVGKPTGTTEHLVLVPRRYLANCTLLC